MNLIIDVGNTFLKAFIFSSEGKLLNHEVFADAQQLSTSAFYRSSDFSSAIICSVNGDTTAFYDVISKKSSVTIFNSETPIPIINKYLTAATLGGDRLAAAIGAFTVFPAQDTLVIDVGTCIKYNFTNSNGEFLGGAISPGLTMRFKALHHFTDKLPLILTQPIEAFKLIGNTTEESLIIGVYKAMLLEIEGFIDAYQKKFPEIKIILTGGDASFFESHLKNSIFADPFIVAKGLNRVLNHSFKK